jgi:hypothetical protein
MIIKLNMNNKPAPNQIRILLRRMRGEKYVVNEDVKTPEKDLTMRDMLKITRNLNEQAEENDEKKAENKKNVYDQSKEEEKLKNFFNDMNVNIKFIDLEVYDNLIFWGGTVDGIIQFVYKVTPDEKTSGVEFNYLEDFSPDNPDNDIIIKKIESYYDSFYKYWRNNMLQ